MNDEKPGIEIRPADLIRRPENAPVRTESVSDMVSSAKSWIKEIKAINDALKEFGIDLAGILNKKQDSAKGEVYTGNQTTPVVPDASDVIKRLMSMVGSKYGDKTLNELINEIRKDYGNKKLRDLMK